MAEPTQYMLTPKQLVELFIRDNKIHEGRWMLAMGFGFAPGNFGPSPDQMNPGVAVVANQIVIQREPIGGGVPDNLVVDAAVVNPAPKTVAATIPPRKDPRKSAKR